MWSHLHEFPDNKQCFNIPLRLCFPAFRMWKVKSTPAEAFWTARSKHGRGMRTEKNYPGTSKSIWNLLYSLWKCPFKFNIIAMRTLTSNIESLAKLTQFYVNIDSLSFSVYKILHFGMQVEYRDGWPHQNGWIFGKVPKEEGRRGGHFQSKNLLCRFFTFKQRLFGTFPKIHPFW